MYTPITVITEALEMSHTTLDQIGDGVDATGTARCLRWLNKVKDRFWSGIVTAVWEDFGWQQWTTNAIAGTGEYPTLEVASDRNGTKKIEAVYIAYDNTLYDTGKLQYTKATEVTRSGLEYEWEWYEANQSAEYPLYIVADQSIFIAPLPQSAVTSGIKITGIQKIADYTDATIEPEMKITAEYAHILVQGLLPYIYRYQWKINEANAETAEYERLETIAMNDLGNRVTSPYYSKYPDEITHTTKWLL